MRKIANYEQIIKEENMRKLTVDEMKNIVGGGWKWSCTKSGASTPHFRSVVHPSYDKAAINAYAHEKNYGSSHHTSVYKYNG